MKYYEEEHKPLSSYVERNLHFANYNITPTFQDLLVTELVVTQGTSKYEMKDISTDTLDFTASQVFFNKNYTRLKSTFWSRLLFDDDLR